MELFHWFTSGFFFYFIIRKTRIMIQRKCREILKLNSSFFFQVNRCYDHYSHSNMWKYFCKHRVYKLHLLEVINTILLNYNNWLYDIGFHISTLFTCMLNNNLYSIAVFYVIVLKMQQLTNWLVRWEYH